MPWKGLLCVFTVAKSIVSVSVRWWVCYIDVNCAFTVVSFPSLIKVKYNTDNIEAQQDPCEAAIL